MTVEELENLPDGVIGKEINTKKEAEDLYMEMFRVVFDRHDAKDCAKIVAQRLGRETQNSIWLEIEQKINEI